MAIQIDKGRITYPEVYKIQKDEDIEFTSEIVENGNAQVTSRKAIMFKGNRVTNSVLKLTSENNLTLSEVVVVNGSSKVNLKSKNAKIDIFGLHIANASVHLEAETNVTIGKLISDNNSTSAITSRIKITSKKGNVYINGDNDIYAERLEIIAKGDIVINQLNGTFGNIIKSTNIEIISTHGSVIIEGAITNKAAVRISALGNISVSKILEHSSLVARCHGQITIDEISTSSGNVEPNIFAELRGSKGISINNVAGNALVKATSHHGAIEINTIKQNANLIYWPANSLQNSSIDNTSTNVVANWLGEYRISHSEEMKGEWWNNWFWTYGYVAKEILKPCTKDELVEIIRESTDPVKVVGGGWSFSDINLPFRNENSIKTISILEKGKGNSKDLRTAIRHMGERKNISIDTYPHELVQSLNHSSEYNQDALRNEVENSYHIPVTPNSECTTIDTRNLKTSLQCNLPERWTSMQEDSEGNPLYYFWVEAGIIMSELSKLLDHQSPRMAIEASGGSPGATLAGTISTATHGGEFKDKLLIDRIKAIHLVGPGGQEWWIQGDQEIISESDLRSIYPNSNINYISRSSANIGDLNSEDFLKTIVVSLGAIGIIYSVIMEVVPQFTVRQKTIKYCTNQDSNGWEQLVERAGFTINDLVVRDELANIAVTDLLKDGALNGTGIPLSQNRYVDLALNPYSKSCWIVNREFTPNVITKHDNSGDVMSGYLTSLSNQLGEGELYPSTGGRAGARLLNFLDLPLNVFGADHYGYIPKFLEEATRYPLPLSGFLAILQAKVTWNHERSSHPEAGHSLISDVLEGVVDALQGTFEDSVSDFTGLSYSVGEIGWPDGGLPGRGYEIALPSTTAFSYTNEILTLIEELKNTNKIFMGYISIRLCPKTDSVVGMQQFEDSVMIEVVGHRTPESNEVFDSLIDFTKSYAFEDINSLATIRPNFHWGLETEKFDRAYLDSTILGQNYKSGLSRLEAFLFIKKHIQNNNFALFDNAFLIRMGLNT